MVTLGKIIQSIAPDEPSELLMSDGISPIWEFPLDWFRDHRSKNPGNLDTLVSTKVKYLSGQLQGQFRIEASWGATPVPPRIYITKSSCDDHYALSILPVYRSDDANTTKSGPYPFLAHFTSPASSLNGLPAHLDRTCIKPPSLTSLFQLHSSLSHSKLSGLFLSLGKWQFHANLAWQST